MAWIHLPTGAAAALEDCPEYSMSGFCSGDAVVASLAKHVSPIEAEDLVEGASGHTIPWTLYGWSAPWMDDPNITEYEDLEVKVVGEVVMFCC